LMLQEWQWREVARGVEQVCDMAIFGTDLIHDAVTLSSL
jgi:hypothetical protein